MWRRDSMIGSCKNNERREEKDGERGEQQRGPKGKITQTRKQRRKKRNLEKIRT
jgi:hypothetical protein